MDLAPTTRQLCCISTYSAQRQDLFVGHAWYETSHSLFIVRHFIAHGDLRNYMRSNDVSSNAAEIVRQVSTGLAILHEKTLFHGDLQPSGYPFTRPITVCGSRAAEYLHILPVAISNKACEFWSHEAGRESTGYLAPERLGMVDMDGEGPVDMWAVGCLIFELLTSILLWSSPVGYPFPLLMLQSYCRKLIPLPIHHFLLKPVLDYDSLFRLVEGLLCCDQGSRLSATGALQSSWLASADTNSAMGEELDDAGELIPADGTEE